MSINYMGVKYGGLTKDKNGTISTSVKHTFHFDDAESPSDILADSNIPAINSELSNGLFAQSIVISEPQEGDETQSAKYIVTVSYTNDLQTDITPEQGDVAPWKKPAYDVSIYGVEIVKSMVKSYAPGDEKDSPSVNVVNAVGDPFDAQTVEQNTVYKFSFNLKDFDDSWIDDYSDTVNNSAIAVIDKTIPAGKGRMRNLNAALQKVYDSDGELKWKYWKVDVEIEKSPNTWKVELMNLGLWVVIAGKRYRIHSNNSNEAPSPGAFGSKAGLLAAGVALDDISAVDTPQKLSADGSTIVWGDDTNYITFFNKAIIDWNPLSLPENLK